MNVNDFIAISKNKVVSLKALSNVNYKLYKYFLLNYKLVKSELEKQEIEILDDGIPLIKSLEQIRIFLQYEYGKDVNLSFLRMRQNSIYNALARYGAPADIVKGMGFEVGYIVRGTDEEFIKKLSKLVDNNKNIERINDQKLYQKIRNHSIKRGFESINDYIQALGFKYRDNSIEMKQVVELKNKGYTYSKIALELGKSVTTVIRLYKKGKEINPLPE